MSYKNITELEREIKRQAQLQRIKDLEQQEAEFAKKNGGYTPRHREVIKNYKRGLET